MNNTLLAGPASFVPATSPTSWMDPDGMTDDGKAHIFFNT